MSSPIEESRGLPDRGDHRWLITGRYSISRISLRRIAAAKSR
jgi:hypothetical protein